MSAAGSAVDMTHDPSQGRVFEVECRQLLPDLELGYPNLCRGTGAEEPRAGNLETGP